MSPYFSSPFSCAGLNSSHSIDVPQLQLNAVDAGAPQHLQKSGKLNIKCAQQNTKLLRYTFPTSECIPKCLLKLVWFLFLVYGTT